MWELENFERFHNKELKHEIGEFYLKGHFLMPYLSIFLLQNVNSIQMSMQEKKNPK